MDTLREVGRVRLEWVETSDPAKRFHRWALAIAPDGPAGAGKSPLTLDTGITGWQRGQPSTSAHGAVLTSVASLLHLMGLEVVLPSGVVLPDGHVADRLIAPPR